MPRQETARPPRERVFAVTLQATVLIKVKDETREGAEEIAREILRTKGWIPAEHKGLPFGVKVQ